MIAWLRQPHVRRRLGICVRWVTIIGTFVALGWYLRGIDYHALGAAVVSAHATPLAVAVLLGLVSQIIRALGWTVMIGSAYHIPFGRQVRYEFTAQAASALIPARAGEMLRVWLLHRDGVPATTTAALVGVKKLFEGVGLCLLAIPALWLLPDLPLWLANTIGIFTGLIVALTVALVLSSRVIRLQRPESRLGRFVAGMAFLREPRRLTAALGLAVVGELADLGAVVLVLDALQIDYPLIVAAVILFVVDTSNLLPSAPAHAGTFEVGVFAAFGALNGLPEAGLAFALVFHTQQVLTQIAVGVPFLLREMLTRRRNLEPSAS